MYDLSSVYYYLPKLLSQPTPTPGQGTMKYADGDQYEGEWKDAKRNGQGTYTWADGQKYVGDTNTGDTITNIDIAKQLTILDSRNVNVPFRKGQNVPTVRGYTNHVNLF